jgi:hypothetical protein
MLFEPKPVKMPIQANVWNESKTKRAGSARIGGAAILVGANLF